MKSTVIERRAHILKLYTGMPWQSALRRVRESAPKTPLIPAAPSQQAFLEAQLLRALAWPLITTLHPWGIRYVDPREDGLRINFENHPVNRQHVGQSMARELVRSLVPYLRSSTEITGIPGLRATVEARHVVLRTLGSPASVVLGGVTAKDWQAAIEAESHDAAVAGYFPCHRDRPMSWHSAERAHAYEGRQASTWLASGLLRRIGILRTAGVPLSTTAWTNPAPGGGEEWIVDHIHAPQHGMPGYHHATTNLFTDPEWGLPLTVTRDHCTCEMNDGDAAPSACCVQLASVDRPGELQLRYTRRQGTALQRHRGAAADVYPDRRKLYVRPAAPQLLGAIPERDQRGLVRRVT